jgi:hypothetical protein
MAEYLERAQMGRRESHTARTLVGQIRTRTTRTTVLTDCFPFGQAVAGLATNPSVEMGTHGRIVIFIVQLTLELLQWVQNRNVCKSSKA